MIEAICKEREHVFMAAVILGLTACPECGSENTSVAVKKDSDGLGESE